MAVGFAALDKRIIRDTETLHDFLWHDEKKDETSLRASSARMGGTPTHSCIWAVAFARTPSR